MFEIGLYSVHNSGLSFFFLFWYDFPYSKLIRNNASLYMYYKCTQGVLRNSLLHKIWFYFVTST